MEYTVDDLAIKKIKLGIKKEKENTYKNAMEHLKDKIFKKSKLFLELSTEQGVSKWLTMFFIAKYGFESSTKKHF